MQDHFSSCCQQLQPLLKQKGSKMDGQANIGYMCATPKILSAVNALARERNRLDTVSLKTPRCLLCGIMSIHTAPVT